MRNLLMGIFVLMLSGTSFAVSLPEEIIVFEDNDMIIENARVDFENVVMAGIELTRAYDSEEVTGITVKLRYRGHDLFPERFKNTRTVRLAIKDIEDIGCGSRRYVADLTSLHHDDNRPYYEQARFSVVLTDHTRRVCKDYRPYMWEADVREGYGWCGTMDSTMTLLGNPSEL